MQPYSSTYSEACRKVLPLLSFYRDMIGKVQDALSDSYLIADIGSGPGILTSQMPEKRIISIDSQFQVISGVSKDAIVGDAHAIPSKSGKFDAMVALNVLPFIQDIDTFLKESYRITNDNGLVLLTGIKHGFDMNAVSEVAKQDLAPYSSNLEYATHIKDVMKWNQQDLQHNIKNLLTLNQVSDLLIKHGFKSELKKELIYCGQSYFVAARKIGGKMNYDEVYQRNIGLFSKDQQEKLSNAKISIAGVGGVGGIQSATLARFGIGELSILDPGVFDAPDMNRQYGAMKSTIGMNKAQAMAPILMDINPFLKLNVYDKALGTMDEVREFVKNSNLVIDAIDYSGFDHKAMFAEVARENNIYNLSAPIPDFGAIMWIFDPKGMTLEEFLGAPLEREAQKTYKIPHERIFGSKYFPQNLKDMLEGRTNYISTNAGAAALNGGLVATEAALIITGRRRDEDIIKVPNVIYIDMFARIYDQFNPLSHQKD